MASKPWFAAHRGEWVMKYRPDPTGKWIRVRLCKHPFPWSPSKPPKKPPIEATDRAREFAEIEYRAKHRIAPPPPRARGLAGYVAAYLNAFRGSHDPGSVKQLERHARRFLAFTQVREIVSVQAVTRADCRDYLEERIKAVSHNTLRTERGYLVPIWTRAVDDGLMAVNPWLGVRVPGKATKPVPTFWTSDEVAAIARHCAKPWQSDLVLVLANTGLRISTALAMRWGWIDWGRGVIAIPPTDRADAVKTQYTLAMGRVARDVLTRRLATSEGADLVFPNPHRGGGIVPYDSARAAIERAIIKAKVPMGTPHCLRHTYARHLMASGVPANIVQAQLGHTTLAMTQKYTEISEGYAAKFLEGFRIGVEPGDHPT